MYSRGLMWFRHDLRVTDNQALSWLAQQASSLACVYIVDPRWFRNGHYQSRHLGTHRLQFLKHSLNDLQKSLEKYGHQLYVIEGKPVDVLTGLVENTCVDCIATTRHPGVYERQQWERLRGRFDHVNMHLASGFELFEEAQLPFSLNDLAPHFTPFRKRVESLFVNEPAGAPTSLPTPLTLPVGTVNWLPDRSGGDYAGGETAGRRQLSHFLFGTDAVKTYKDTRNGLDGWLYSSKLSPWLANGCISARQVFSELKRYERERISNESTYWLYFELLWREYFQWSLYKHQHGVFRFEGVQEKRPLTSFWPQRFAMWCQGETPYPIVNACMKQLNATGFMSNRGRQLVASCLVHELNLDWRYGAAYFEQQLIDFDVAANWGNWQYLAGVGADPRGHRRFDLAKQTRLYDPDGEFVRTWQGNSNNHSIDHTDAADWPVS